MQIRVWRGNRPRALRSRWSFSAFSNVERHEPVTKHAQRTQLAVPPSHDRFNRIVDTGINPPSSSLQRDLAATLERDVGKFDAGGFLDRDRGHVLPVEWQAGCEGVANRLESVMMLLCGSPLASFIARKVPIRPRMRPQPVPRSTHIAHSAVSMRNNGK